MPNSHEDDLEEEDSEDDLEITNIINQRNNSVDRQLQEFSKKKFSTHVMIHKLEMTQDNLLLENIPLYVGEGYEENESYKNRTDIEHFSDSDENQSNGGKNNRRTPLNNPLTTVDKHRSELQSEIVIDMEKVNTEENALSINQTDSSNTHEEGSDMPENDRCENRVDAQHLRDTNKSTDSENNNNSKLIPC